jgi:anti-sigma-K factor RskA
VRLGRSDPHTLAGPYALDALAARDRGRFERHLGRCEACQQEGRSLHEAAARLAEVSRARPPERLRSQVLAAAAGTRQLPPAVDGDGQRAGYRRRSALHVPRLALAVAGGVILLLLGLGSVAVTSSQHRLGQEQAHSREIASVMNAPDATMVTGHASRGSATVVMSHADRKLVLTTVSLPSLPPAMGYQVWLMGPDGVRQEGMLPAPRRGMTPPMVVGGLASGDKIALTVEPAAGMKHPTSHMVLELVLP